MVCLYSKLSFCLLACGTALAKSSGADADTDLDTDLPDVESIMSEATKTVSSLAKEAEKMEEAMNSTQAKRLAHLDKLRASYTSRLAAKDKHIERLTAVNSRTQRQAESLEAGNERLRSSAKMLQELNRGLRSMFTAFSPKFTGAKVFLRSGMNASAAPLNAKQIQVLESPHPQPSLENFLKELRVDRGRHSLVQLNGRSTVRRYGASAAMQARAHAAALESAEDIVGELSKQMAKIGKAQEEGDMQMKANFLANYEARQLKIDGLVAEQTKLNATKLNATKEQQDLRVAKEALLQVKEDLLERMKGIGTFALGSAEYVTRRLAMASNATGDLAGNGTKTASAALMQSETSTRPVSGELRWF